MTKKDLIDALASYSSDEDVLIYVSESTAYQIRLDNKIIERDKLYDFKIRPMIADVQNMKLDKHGVTIAAIFLK